MLRGAAACRDRESSEAITRAIEALRKLGRIAAEHLDLETLGVAHAERIVHMAQAFLANLRVEPTDNSVELQAEGFGTLADARLDRRGRAVSGKGRESEREYASKGTTP